MQIEFLWAERAWVCDLSQVWDVSLCFGGEASARAWYCPPVEAQPVRAGDFVGSVREGGSVNFYDVRFNPHGNGSHTEGPGHLHLEHEVLRPPLQPMPSYVCSVPLRAGAIVREDLEAIWPEDLPIKALVIRTLPNALSKKSYNHSGQDSAYVSLEAMEFLVGRGIEHLLLDLPSVDPERDGGALLAHRCFWAGEARRDCTLTELIFVPSELVDGLYWLNLQTAPFLLDALPARPLLSPMFLKK